ncbi:MCE family protein [Actinomadura kijaniata]|uniref:MCE family protein n=1 Tax=Actinomadura kijaniata TaxID=46161 RepID=UPI003F1DF15F
MVLAPLRDNRARVLEALLLVFVLLVAVGLVAVLAGPSGRKITAYFTTAIGVYPGSDVRVLGVKVGSIDSVEPQGGRIRVVMDVDREVDVPADARAVVIAPNLVSDRYVQLAPAYNGGAKLASGAVIDTDRTATPMELDQLYDAVRKFTTDLGPQGVNARGALSEVIRVGATNLGGNGKLLNTTIAEMGKASTTLANSSDDLYATVGHLNRFSEMLRANDGRIREAERRLADVSGYLAADREELAAALANLARALGEVKEFIVDNRRLLKKNVDKLADITQVLVDQRAALAETLDNAPLLAQNAVNAYDPGTRSLMSRGNLLEITKAFGSTSQPGVDPVATDTRPVCAAAGSATPELRAQCERLRASGLTAAPPSAPDDAPPLPLPPAGSRYTGTAPKGGR